MKHPKRTLSKSNFDLGRRPNLLRASALAALLLAGSIGIANADVVTLKCEMPGYPDAIGLGRTWLIEVDYGANTVHSYYLNREGDLDSTSANNTYRAAITDSLIRWREPFGPPSKGAFEDISLGRYTGKLTVNTVDPNPRTSISPREYSCKIWASPPRRRKF
jgi:hypothetical protein